MTETMKAPAAAMRFRSAFQLQAEPTGDDKDPKFAPFEMIGRSAGPIDHFFFGKVVHDMDGMVLDKDRITVDFMHDAFTSVGFANKFEATEDGLKLSGAVVSTRDGDRASEIIAQSRAGIPFEASIDFVNRMPGDTVAQQVAEGEVAEVNGFQFEGPGVIFRKWRLNKMAITPGGEAADASTSTELLGRDKDAEVTLTLVTGQTNESKKDAEMNKNETGAEEVVNDGERLDNDADKQLDASGAADAAAEATTDGDANAEATGDGSASDDRAEFGRFVDEFGIEQGARYYKDGLSFDAALRKCVADLRSENSELKAGKADSEPVVAAQSDEGNDAAAFSASEDRDGDVVKGTDAERELCAKMGVNYEAYLQTKAKNKVADELRRKERSA